MVISIIENEAINSKTYYIRVGRDKTSCTWLSIFQIVPCCETLCGLLWLVVVVLALLRSVLDRIWTSAVGRALLRLLTTLLVPTLVPCGVRTELSVECELVPPEGFPLEPPYRLVLLSFAMPELPLVLPELPPGLEQRKH